MSTISDWKADYTTADTNVPTGSTPLPFPPVGDGNSLGEVIRDRKAVIRQESLNKGWTPDALTATYVSADTFTVTGDQRALFPLNAAVKYLKGTTTGYSWVWKVSFAAGVTTVQLVDAFPALDPTLTQVIPSALLPGSTPVRNAAGGYPVNVGSPFPLHVSQIGAFDVSGSTTSAVVPFSRKERDLNYFVLLQLVSGGGPNINSTYVANVVKDVDKLSINFRDAPGGGWDNTWEYCILRSA